MIVWLTAAQQALSSLSSKVQGQSIPDQHGSAHVAVGKVKYDITRYVTANSALVTESETQLSNLK